MLEDALGQWRRRKRLIERSPPSLITSDLAGLDVADVGRADQIERAGLRAHDPGVAKPAQRQRAEAVRIAHGDQAILRQEHQRKRAADLRDRLDQRLFDRRRPRSRVQVQDHLGVAGRLEDRRRRAPARRAARAR